MKIEVGSCCFSEEVQCVAVVDHPVGEEPTRFKVRAKPHESMALSFPSAEDTLVEIADPELTGRCRQDGLDAIAETAFGYQLPLAGNPATEVAGSRT